MNDILKQRLVGALILLALGVIFWPIIFVQPGDKEAAQQRSVPERPGVSTRPLEAPSAGGMRASPDVARQEAEDIEPAPPIEPVRTAAPAAEPEPESKPRPAPKPAAKTKTVEVRKEAPQPLAMDRDGLPVAWILQVASVSNAAKADELRDRLVGLGHKAHVKKVRANGKDLYRVYIGPKFERARLEDLQSQINSEFGVSSMIARYVP